MRGLFLYNEHAFVLSALARYEHHQSCTVKEAVPIVAACCQRNLQLPSSFL